MPEPRLVHFLLVEDDDDHAMLVTRSLQRSRVSNQVDRVSDGEAALSYLRQKGEFAGRQPDVVLLDLKLPKVDGHEVLRQIKEDPTLRQIPIVVLTTSQAEIDRARAYEHHANSYLVKPVNFERFQQMIEDLNLYWGVWNIPANREA